jgi:hypothetical protein
MGAVQKIAAQEVAQTNLITPQAMIQQAIQAGSGVEVMERLLALQERHDAFQARKAFDDAMADLRMTLPRITKSREVDFTTSKGRTNYKFEDLAEITELLSEPMSTVGLSWRWYTDNVQGGVKVTCRITHRAGHYEETSLVGPLDATGNKNAIQAIGSAVSYLQRYTLKAAVGIAAAHDDDAQAAGQKREEARQPADNSRAILAGFDSDIQSAANASVLKAIWARIEASTLTYDQRGELSAIINNRLAYLKTKPANPVPAAEDPFGFDRMEQDIPYGEPA